MNITLREYTDFNLEEILSLYDSVGWSSYTGRPERLQRSALWRESACCPVCWTGG